MTDQANRHVYATSLGGDVVLQFRFDAGSGRITPSDPPSVRSKPKAGPRHLAFAPDGRFLYLINELDGTVNGYQVAAATGALTERQGVLYRWMGFLQQWPLVIMPTSSDLPPKQASDTTLDGQRQIINSMYPAFMAPLLGLPGPGLLAAKAADRQDGRYLMGAGADAIRGPRYDRDHFDTEPSPCYVAEFNTLAAVSHAADAGPVVRLLRETRTVNAAIEMARKAKTAPGRRTIGGSGAPCRKGHGAGSRAGAYRDCV